MHLRRERPDLLAIGIKGGAALRASSPAELWAPALATLVLGVVTPLVAVAAARRLGRFDIPDAAGLAAHYGSVSVVTFTAVMVAAATAGLSPGGAAVLAVMAASASYIAAPAAVSLALPSTDPALSLTAALGMTFPFNLLIGIPLFVWVAPQVVPS